MNTIKTLGERLKRLKWYYVSLIVIGSLYLVVNTVTIWAPMNNVWLLIMGLMNWVLLISSVVMLILTIIEATNVYAEKPEYKFNIQYIVAYVLLGAIGFFTILSLFIATSHEGDISHLTDSGTGVKMVSWIMVFIVVGGIILFYVLSLQKSMHFLKENSKVEEFKNDKTPKEE
ncbi:hypothetical protein [Mycoplasma todarodis]|uniref:hypothetical protein n=1 Tax=Mycoplasma todarodis TaxID=1937191 RepID=UPI003B2A6A58